MAPMPVPLSPGRPAARSSLMAGGHVRSASVPCHTHPLLLDIDDQLLALRSWTSNPGQNPLSLAHVRALLLVLDDLLHLPLAQAALVRTACADDSLLDGILVLADAFGTFLAALLALRQHAAPSSSPPQVGRELEQLAAAVAREAARCARASLQASSTTCGAPAELEITRTVAEAVNGTAVASASSSSPKKRLPLSSRSKQQRCGSEEQREAAALGKLQELEQCVGELESESEVFRSLVQTRVSLLNIHTPTF
ncbi:hypothetical protein PVAP13_4KG381903 [Panicum virgatum]|uniref:Uncharacterized protein n=1 Tax=Panicum virgatum TaxID=38727 RepID=A0A8T0TU45_PANVG|nr:hypothetical protein PVAP13_4KG381903 [Panicum virgatum]